MSSNLRETAPRDLLRCPMMRQIMYEARLYDAPRRVIDQVLTWHAQLRTEQATDCDFFTGQEEIVWAEGWPPFTPVDADYRPGATLGALLWSAQEDGSWWTDLGYVALEARQQGLYRMLWEACVHKAREAGVKRIQGGTAYGNVAMQRCMERLGRVPHSVIYDYEVPRGPDEP